MSLVLEQGTRASSLGAKIHGHLYPGGHFFGYSPRRICLSLVHYMAVAMADDKNYPIGAHTNRGEEEEEEEEEEEQEQHGNGSGQDEGVYMRSRGKRQK